MIAPSFLPPLAVFDVISMDAANECLVRWGHKRGPCTRPQNYGAWAHALYINGEPAAVVTAHTLVREYVGGETERGPLRHLSRAAAVELSRLCADRPTLCRVALRLWRELVFPRLGFPVVISYQDAVEHTGATYRNDGWERLALAEGGGGDSRSPSGNEGSDRWVWAWPRGAAESLRAELPALPKRTRREPHPSLFVDDRSTPEPAASGALVLP